MTVLHVTKSFINCFGICIWSTRLSNNIYSDYFKVTDLSVAVVHVAGTTTRNAEFHTRIQHGFYQLAQAAQVPLAVVRLDYGQKVVRFEDFMYLKGNVLEDYAHIRKLYAGVKGFYPEKATPIEPLPLAGSNGKRPSAK